MKMSIILSVLAVAISASAGQTKQAECKAGYTEFARCKAVSLSSVGQGIDGLGKEMARVTMAMYGNVVACSKGKSSAYVQLTVPEINEDGDIDQNGNVEISPEAPAKITSTGATHTVEFALDATSSIKMIFGGRAGGKHNGQIVTSFDRNKKTFATYEADCSYKR